MTTPASDLKPQSALRHKPFRLYFAAGLVSYLGMWFEKVALGWFAWELTQSSFWTGFVAVAVTAPTGLLGPLIGVLAERWNHRKASIILNLLLGSASVGLFVLATLDGVSILPVAALALAIGILSALYHPVRLVLVSQVVPRQFLVSAVSLTAMAYNVSRVVGPALAGIVIAAAGTQTAFLVNAGTYLPIAIVLPLLPLLARPRPSGDAGGLGAQLMAGLRYARGQRLIWWAIGIAVISSLLGRGAAEIMPAIVGQLLGGTAGDLAFFTSLAGAGAVAASLLYSFLSPPSARIGLWLALSLPLNTLSIMALGLAQSNWQMAALFVASGFFTTIIGIGSQTIVQVSVDDAYRARVLTWWSSANFGGATLGAMSMGIAGDIFPLSVVLLTFGLVGTVVGIWSALRPRV